MSFWNNPGASFEGLMHNPWHSMENFATTGLVPLIPMVASYYGGPVAGGVSQNAIDYFSGNSNARTGKGMVGSFANGFGKGYLSNLGASYGGDYLSSLGGESSGGMLDSIGGDGGSFSGDLFQIDPNGAYNPSTGIDWADTGSGLTGNGVQGYTPQEQASLDELINQQSAKYPMDNASSPNKPTFQQQLGRQLAKTNLGSPMQQASQYRYQEQPIQRQPAFQAVSQAPAIQERKSDIEALISALRSKGAFNGE